jgi:hypothetical protein
MLKQRAKLGGSADSGSTGRRAFGLFFPLFLAATLVGAMPGPGWAQDSMGSASMEKMVDERLSEIPTGEEGVQQVLNELDARLKLSPEQKKDVREPVEMMVAAMEKLRDRFKSGELNAMALAMKLQMEGQKSAMLIESLLSEAQQGEYAAMRQEQRRQMMQAMQKERMAAPK